MGKKKVSLTAQAIANEFLTLSRKENKPILTNLQIQKLVYIAYGYFSYFENKPLFDERIEAWQHGPVIPALYYEAKKCGSKEFPDDFKFTNSRYTGEKDDFGDPKFEIYPPTLEGVDGSVKKVINFVFKNYGKIDGWSLRGLTHRENSPWDTVYDGGLGSFQQIPYGTIKEYYDIFVPALYKSLSELK